MYSAEGWVTGITTPATQTCFTLFSPGKGIITLFGNSHSITLFDRVDIAFFEKNERFFMAKADIISLSPLRRYPHNYILACYLSTLINCFVAADSEETSFICDTIDLLERKFIDADDLRQIEKRWVTAMGIGPLPDDNCLEEQVLFSEYLGKSSGLRQSVIEFITRKQP